MMVFAVEIWKHTSINLSVRRRTAVSNSDLTTIIHLQKIILKDSRIHGYDT